MRKLILPLAMATATIASAADIEIHGDVNMDYASYFDSDFDPTNAGNQDINLALKAHLDENIAVVVKGTTHSTFVNENGDPEVQKSTKTPILCSKSQKTRVPEAKKAQKPRFCARKARKQGFLTPKAHKNPDFVLGKTGIGTRKRGN